MSFQVQFSHLGINILGVFSSKLYFSFFRVRSYVGLGQLEKRGEPQLEIHVRSHKHLNICPVSIKISVARDFLFEVLQYQLQ